MKANGFLIFLMVNLFSTGVTLAENKPKMAVMPLTAKQLPEEIVSILDDVLFDAVYQTGRYQLISPSDINAVIGFEKMKDAADCDQLTCASEIGGALGVSALLTGSVGKLGKNLVVTLKIINTQKPAILRQVHKEFAGGEEQYSDFIKGLVPTLFRTNTEGSPVIILLTEGRIITKGMPRWLTLDLKIIGGGNLGKDSVISNGLKIAQESRGGLFEARLNLGFAVNFAGARGLFGLFGGVHGFLGYSKEEFIDQYMASSTSVKFITGGVGGTLGVSVWKFGLYGLGQGRIAPQGYDVGAGILTTLIPKLNVGFEALYGRHANQVPLLMGQGNFRGWTLQGFVGIRF